MKLFKLTIKECLLSPSVADANDYAEWTSPRGFVLLADDEDIARRMAAFTDEDLFPHETVQNKIWFNPELTTCEEISLDQSRYIMANVPTG